MESSFRRVLKKSKPILWLVIASMVGSSLSVFFTKNTNGGSSYVAKVNGNIISAREYQRSLAGIQAYIASMQQYAASSNIPFEFFLKMLLGGSDLSSVALENCIKSELMSDLSNNLNVQLDEKDLQDGLVKGLPGFLLDEKGAVNMQAYADYVQRLGITVADYEAEKTLEMKRAVVEQVIAAADYTPVYETADAEKQAAMKKSFELLSFDLQDFIKKESANKISAAELESFYDKNKNDYREPELRRMQYFVVSTKNNEQSVVVDDASIQAYYDKNKSSQFRVAPKVSVRRMVFSGDLNGRKKAEDVYGMLKDDSSQFAALVKQHSLDAASVKNGSLVPLFSRGSHDVEFENASFRLQKQGDISPVFKSALGYEIVQLVERVNAVEKSLNDVREQIIKTLKTRKAAVAVKNDIEFAIRMAKENDQSLLDLSVKYKASIVDTPWMIKDGEYKDLDAQLKDKAFSRAVATKKAGFFSTNNDYVVYFPVQVKESKIPSFSAVKNNVERDYVQVKAQDAQRDAVKAAKVLALRNEKTFKELAASTDARHIDIAPSFGDSKIDKLKDLGQLQAKLFMLSADNQVVEYAHKDTLYLGKIVSIEPAGDASQNKGLVSGAKKSKQGVLTAQAFIASLRRNATIDIKKEALNAYKRF